jgi:hypothetical protein
LLPLKTTSKNGAWRGWASVVVAAQRENCSYWIWVNAYSFSIGMSFSLTIQ